MGPHAPVLGEIGGMEPGAVVVAVKAKWSRWKRISADQLSNPMSGRCIWRKLALHVIGEAPALGFAAIDGKVGIAQDETSDNVGSAGDRLERQRLHIVADPVVLPVIKNGASRQDGAQGCKVEMIPRHESGAITHLQVCGTRAKDRHLLLRCQCPQGLWPSRAVVTNAARTAGKRGKLPMPHQPSAGCVERHAVATAKIAVKSMLVEVRDQRATRPMTDAFGLSRGSGRK